ncbi:hypothetical protein Tco_0832494 [Tanacetum coccineum]
MVPTCQQVYLFKLVQAVAATEEAIFLLLTGIGDDIYSTVDACKTANEMWIAIERLQQGESLNVQDVKTNLFWEFGKFTSRDRESMESYYLRFYKLMNELTRNNLQVTTMQVNVQFLQQLQREWSRFVTVIKQSKEIDTISYHTLFDILKQHQNEVNDIRAERIAKISEEDSDPEQAQRDKDMQKNLALLAKYFKKLYKPTNNNLRTSSNSRNKTKDTTPRYNNDNQSRQFGNQRTMTVAGARETVGSQECRKPKRVKDYAYHKEKMMMCKQAEQGVPLQAEQADWLEDTDEEIDEQELEAHYSYMAKIQEVDQNAVECVDERDALANLIANLTLDTEENKMILKQLKKANASLTQELEKCKTNLDETNSALGEAISCRDSCLIALQNKQNEFEKYKAFNDRTIDYEILQTKLNETLGLLALKDIEIKEGLKTKAYEISVLDQKHDDLVKKSLLTKSQLEGYLKENTKVISDLKVKEEKDIDKIIEMDKQLKFLNEIVYTRNQSIQTIHMLAPKCATYNGRLTFANPRYLKKAQSEKPYLYEIPYDNSDHANRFAPEREETMTLENESRSKLNKDKVKPYDYTNQNSLYEIFKGPSLEYLYQLERAKEVRKTMWRKPFVRTKPNIAKNVAFLPVSKSISKSRQVFNEMTFNINQFREIVDQTWFKHTSDYFRVPTAHDMELLIKTLLMHLSIKSQNDSFRFEHELKTEMHEDYEYVKSLEKEVDELESEKADFSNIYDLLLEECVSKDVTCSYLHSLSDLNAYTELQCLYLHKVRGMLPISASKPKRKRTTVAIPHKKIVASDTTIQKSKSYYKELYENYKIRNGKGGYTKESPFRIQFVNVPCTVHFGNDQFALILGYGDLIQGNVTIKRVYYVEGLNHNLFSVGQFCDADLESRYKRVYNKRTRLIVESIHIKFDEIKEMMSDHNSSDLALQRQEMFVENVSSGLVPQGQKALVPSCFVIFDLEPLSLSLCSRSLNLFLACLDHLCHLAILCLDQHAHTLHHFESLLTISLDRLDIFEGRSCISEFFEHEHVVDSKNLLDRVSSSKRRVFRIDVVDFHLACLLPERLKADNTVRVNQIVTIFLIKPLIHLLDLYQYPVDTSLNHVESRKSPTAVPFDDDTGRISIRHYEY